MASLRWLTSMAAAALLVGACSVEETEPTMADPLATESGFCEALASRVCNEAVVTACYLSDDATLADDQGKCVAAMMRRSHCNPGNFPYERDGAEACIDAMAKAYSDAKLTQEEMRAAAEACLAVFSSGGPPSSSCTEDSDCDGAEGLRCVIKSGESGTCQKPEVVAVGDSCDRADQVCDLGLYCGQDDACVKKKQPGESCNETRPCDDSALCVNEVCVSKKDNGESCTHLSECKNGFCVKAAGAEQGICGAQLVLAPTTGDSCAPFLD